MRTEPGQGCSNALIGRRRFCGVYIIRTEVEALLHTLFAFKIKAAGGPPEFDSPGMNKSFAPCTTKGAMEESVVHSVIPARC